MIENESAQTAPLVPPAAAATPMPGMKLDTPTRLKLARGIIDRTCQETGAGYLLIMFVPGTDLVLRSFKGLDSPEECAATVAEVAGLLQPHVDAMKAGAPKPKHNDV